LPTAPAISAPFTTVVTEVLEANPDTSPLDIETAIRTANGQAYLVANRTMAGFQIVLGITELGEFAREIMIEIISGSELTCQLTGENARGRLLLHERRRRYQSRHHRAGRRAGVSAV
jgi:hypothetical protein